MVNAKPVRGDECNGHSGIQRDRRKAEGFVFFGLTGLKSVLFLVAAQVNAVPFAWLWPCLPGQSMASVAIVRLPYRRLSFPWSGPAAIVHLIPGLLNTQRVERTP